MSLSELQSFTGLLTCFWLLWCRPILIKLAAVFFWNKQWQCDVNNTLVTTNSSNGWSGAPKELLELVSLRLNLKGRVRMSCVCKSWRQVATQTDLRYPPQMPWFLLSQTSKSEMDKVSFYDLSEASFHAFRIPHGARASCYGASRGWLLIATTTTLFCRNRKQLFLWNPITSAQLQLPSPDTIPTPNREQRRRERKWLMDSKIILSSEDASQSTAAFIGHKNLLALCKLGNQYWSIFKGLGRGGHVYDDILFSKAGTTLYILVHDEDETMTKCETRLFKLNDHREVKLVFIYARARTNMDRYLVESADGDELYIINRVLEAAGGREPVGFVKTSKFEVYKLSGYDGDSNQRIRDDNNNMDTGLRMTRLNHLNDRLLLLSFAESYFFQVESPAKSYNKNCICFFTRDERPRGPTPYSMESGLFEIGSGRIVARDDFELPLHSLIGLFRPTQHP